MTDPSKNDQPIRPRRRGRYIRNLVAFFVLILFLLLVGSSVFLGIQRGNTELYPTRVTPCCQTPADFGMDFREVSFQTEDGLILRGWYVPSKNGAAIILGHGQSGNRIGLLTPAAMLAKHGYGILLFDLRAHGASDGNQYAFGWRDGVAAAQFLKAQPEVDANRIGALGFSLGAVMAVQSAAHTPDIGAVIADGIGATGMEDFPARTTLLDWWALPYDAASLLTIQLTTQESLMSMKAAVKAISPRPILFITFSPDEANLDVEPLLTQNVYDVASEPKTLWQIPGVGHTGGLATYPQEYEDRTLSFFDTSLPLNRS